MFFLALFLYFAIAVALVAALALPDFRHRVVAACAAGGTGLRALSRATRAGVARAGNVSSQGVGDAGNAVRGHLVAHRFLWASSTILLLLAVLLGAVFGYHSVLSFDDRVREVDEKVEALLKGEQLVAPLPLPPELFATAEVEMVRPMTREGSRDWSALDPDFRNRLLMVYKIMKEQHGYDMALLEGYRSPERQARLAALGPQVTRAGANQSYHQHGLAADSAFARQSKLVISEQDPWAMEGYRRYGDAAESLGLVWGGRWSFRDYGHVEYHKACFKLPRN